MILSLTDTKVLLWEEKAGKRAENKTGGEPKRPKEKNKRGLKATDRLQDLEDKRTNLKDRAILISFYQTDKYRSTVHNSCKIRKANYYVKVCTAPR